MAEPRPRSPIITPELKADGWREAATDWIYWVNPSQQSVGVCAYPRCNVDSPAYPSEPDDPKREGYLVSHLRHSDLGDPIDGDSVWVEYLDLALQLANDVRSRVLASVVVRFPWRQLSFGLDHAKGGSK